jgi:hypothetical protein
VSNFSTNDVKFSLHCYLNNTRHGDAPTQSYALIVYLCRITLPCLGVASHTIQRSFLPVKPGVG